MGEAGEAVGSVDGGVTEPCVPQAAAEGCALEEGGKDGEGTEEECDCVTGRGDVYGRVPVSKRAYDYQMESNAWDVQR